ncbi:MAG: SixA phosphatase family protein [Solirubrobacteraceae bacterium]
MSEPKQLFLLRHAKSSWDDPGLDDHERPLAPRGRRAVQILGKHLRDNDIRPVQVLCSTSRRTRETLEGVAPGGETLIEAELYHADAEQLLQRLRRVSDDVESVMVIGHNPTLQITALRLSEAGASNGDGSYRSQISQKFPTGALATLSFECQWSELGPGCARLVDYVRPKAIARRSTNAHAPE